MIWNLRGKKAKLAARQLLISSSTKRRQLQLIANWPTDPSDVEGCTVQLRQLKEWDSAADFRCSWSYCAGFFDADGCISLRENGSMVVKFTQKFPKVLDGIAAFIAQTCGVTACMYRLRKTLFELRVHKQSDCKLVLRQMLEAGLSKKAAQARLALSLTAQNAGQVRAEFAQLVGNQQHGRRLDEAGAQRALRINRLHAQARSFNANGQHGKASAVNQEIQALKREHALLKAELETSQLCDYIQFVESLQRSGWQMPSPTKIAEEYTNA